MINIKFTINGQEIQVPKGTSILKAAQNAEIYIPTICHHPDLPPAKGTQASSEIFQGEVKIKNTLPRETGKGCGLCVVEVEGEPDLLASCHTEAKTDMVVITDNERIKKKRRENLIPILARHRHACLTCTQQEGCSLSECSSNVTENERCCSLFGRCELQAVANYVGISPTTPRWVPANLPVIDREPLFIKDYSLCIGCTRCVRVCRDLRGIEAIGFVYDENDEVQVGALQPTLEASGCKFCTACVEVCPTGALMDKSVRPGRKEADIVRCVDACPVHMDVPGYLRLIAEGKTEAANAVIREKVPLPGVLGRICTHPCEEACRRGEVNAPVSICALKRYAAESNHGLCEGRSEIMRGTGKRVTVIGAGPAGLTAAFYLNKLGYSVTLFEGRAKAGGMLRHGIPAYRLPEEQLDKEINDILSHGIEFRPNEVLGRDFSLTQLKADGYRAVFLAVGAGLSHQISFDGSNSDKILSGIDFLNRISEGEDIKLKNRIIVVGGGDVAIDAALSAFRCGAQKVTMVCLEKRDDMPADRWAITDALEEGVKLMNSWSPQRVIIEYGKMTGMELVHCHSVFDHQGEFNPSYDNRKTFLKGDQVILAVGQIPDLAFLGEDGKISVDKGFIVVDRDSLETGMSGIYAGGDIISSEGTVVHAIADGRKAASAIDRALGGQGIIDEVLFPRDCPNPVLGRDEGFATWDREQMPQLELAARHQGFHEVALGYNKTQAVKEAKRCLQCDLRLYLGSNPFPPTKILSFTPDEVTRVPEIEGVYQLYDKAHNVLAVKGTANLRKDLLNALDSNPSAVGFVFEENRAYSQRENELIQQYLREHGELPQVGDLDLDDLF